MTYDEFIARVAAAAETGEDDAARSSEAVLRTLADRIGPKEARDTASQLPKELKAALESADENAGAFDAHEFVRRVAERAGTDSDIARTHARAVFVALREA